ncbi:GNAT family N-acetyltransferase [Paenibacillus thermoaerophilus]|uniref:GNAT family N-acetyltransferase n=1 Tax=Paenibacillus thermoaerophilus TaxID=1215385 RepID=A0ABW2V1U4_9BACL|nr:GNAT family N-acetyltransferase [Paenibacillus thermoaerophilus]TMV13910.1 GNAT family N-acetyltransferase [Paenibacillus thermoaerophilus]
MPDMLVKLYDLPEQETLKRQLAASGIKIVRALAPQKHLVTEWVRTKFQRQWADECEVTYSRVPVSTFIAVHNGEIVGFACYDSICKGYFGPTGVDESMRGKGVGKALMLACLHAMAAEGYGYAVIGAAGPVDFYKKTVGAIEIPDSSPGIYGAMIGR